MGVGFPDCSGNWRSKKNGSKVSVALLPCGWLVMVCRHILMCVVFTAQMASRRMRAMVAPVVTFP